MHRRGMMRRKGVGSSLPLKPASEVGGSGGSSLQRDKWQEAKGIKGLKM